MDNDQIIKLLKDFNQEEIKKRLNIRDEYGNTLLMYAVNLNKEHYNILLNKENFDFLIDNTDIKNCNNYNETVLMLVLKNNNINGTKINEEQIDKIINKSEVNKINDFGHNAFFYALVYNETRLKLNINQWQKIVNQTKFKNKKLNRQSIYMHLSWFKNEAVATMILEKIYKDNPKMVEELELFLKRASKYNKTMLVSVLERIKVRNQINNGVKISRKNKKNKINFLKIKKKKI